MRYFKATEQESKPFITWSLFANDLQELTGRGLENDPLIVEETNIPANVYNVCPLKIVDGELVNRTEPEMAIFEDEYNVTETIAHQTNVVERLKTETFSYDANIFPMHESARLIYELYETLGGNRKIITTVGDEYDLLNENIPAFMTAFRNKLLTVIAE